MTPNEIKQRGFEPITSEQQLRGLPDGFKIFLSHDGLEARAVKRGLDWIDGAGFLSLRGVMESYVGFRHVPDAVPEPEAAGGFEKKRGFDGAEEMAQYIFDCHAHIDKQAAEIARLDRLASDTQNELDKAVEEIEALKTKKFTDGIPQYEDFSGLPDTAPMSGKLRKRNFFIFKDTTNRERDLIEHIKECYAEIDRLQSPREWVAIESAEQLDALPDGTYEFYGNDGLLNATVKDNGKFVRCTNGLAHFYSHYRLITRASDFTPPERLYRIEDGEYTRAQIMELLGENE